MMAADVRLLESATRDYRDSLHDEAMADANYKRAWSRVFLAASGARYIKEAAADDQCADEYEAKLVSAARCKALKEYLWTIRARLDALRSLNTNIRAQV